MLVSDMASDEEALLPDDPLDLDVELITGEQISSRLIGCELGVQMGRRC